MRRGMPLQSVFSFFDPVTSPHFPTATNVARVGIVVIRLFFQFPKTFSFRSRS